MADYNFFNEDKKNYSYSWSANSSLALHTNSSMDRVNKAFQYRSAESLNGYPIMGEYNMYWGGGYVYEMRGNILELQANLSALRSLDWIDRQTRAVFVEFSTYNPNINMFGVCEFLLEFLASGNIVLSRRIDAVDLLTRYSGFALFSLVCDIFYIVLVVYYMYQELRSLCKIGARKYFTEFWSILEWLLIGFSWAAVAMYAYRIYSANDVLNFFKKTNGYAYYKMQGVAIWDNNLRYCLSFCAALGTLKFLKLLRFDKRISFFASTMKHSSRELMAFGTVALVIGFAFIQLFYLLFNSSYDYSTFSRAITTCFQILLGKFSLDGLIQANNILGPLIFALYNIFTVFILLNMFISIIADTFAAVRLDASLQNDDYQLVDFIIKKLKNWTGIGKKKYIDTFEENPVLDKNKHQYRDQISYFPEKMDHLLQSLSEVCIDLLELISNQL
jgi:polycystin 1L2